MSEFQIGDTVRVLGGASEAFMITDVVLDEEFPYVLDGGLGFGADELAHAGDVEVETSQRIFILGQEVSKRRARAIFLALEEIV